MVVGEGGHITKKDKRTNEVVLLKLKDFANYSLLQKLTDHYDNCKHMVKITYSPSYSSEG